MKLSSFGSSLGACLTLAVIALTQSVAAQIPSTADRAAEEEKRTNCTHQEAEDRTLVVDPDLNTADMLLCLGRLDEAIATYNRLILRYELVTVYASYASFQLGNALVRQNNLEEALLVLQRGIELDPLYGSALFPERNQSPLGEINFNDAADHKQGPTVSQDPVEASAYFELGQILEKERRWEEAIAASEQAIQLSPQFAYAYNTLARIFYQQNRLEESIAASRNAIALNPKLSWGYYNLGKALAARGELAAAREAFRQVIDFHSSLETIGDRYKEEMVDELLADVLKK